MEVGVWFSWEIEIDDDVDSLDINSSRNQVRTDKGFELAFPKPVKNLDSFISFHVRMKVLIFIFLFVEFFGKEFCSFVGSAENNALIDD